VPDKRFKPNEEEERVSMCDLSSNRLDERRVEVEIDDPAGIGGVVRSGK
jgi:hypothetical protein